MRTVTGRGASRAARPRARGRRERAAAASRRPAGSAGPRRAGRAGARRRARTRRRGWRAHGSICAPRAVARHDRQVRPGDVGHQREVAVAAGTEQDARRRGRSSRSGDRRDRGRRRRRAGRRRTCARWRSSAAACAAPRRGARRRRRAAPVAGSRTAGPPARAVSRARRQRLRATAELAQPAEVAAVAEDEAVGRQTPPVPALRHRDVLGEVAVGVDHRRASRRLRRRSRRRTPNSRPARRRRRAASRYGRACRGRAPAASSRCRPGRGRPEGRPGAISGSRSSRSRSEPMLASGFVSAVVVPGRRRRGCGGLAGRGVVTPLRGRPRRPRCQRRAGRAHDATPRGHPA